MDHSYRVADLTVLRASLQRAGSYILLASLPLFLILNCYLKAAQIRSIAMLT